MKLLDATVLPFKSGMTILVSDAFEFLPFFCFFVQFGRQTLENMGILKTIYEEGTLGGRQCPWVPSESYDVSLASLSSSNSHPSLRR